MSPGQVSPQKEMMWGHGGWLLGVSQAWGGSPFCDRSGTPFWLFFPKPVSLFGALGCTFLHPPICPPPSPWPHAGVPHHPSLSPVSSQSWWQSVRLSCSCHPPQVTESRRWDIWCQGGVSVGSAPLTPHISPLAAPMELTGPPSAAAGNTSVTPGEGRGPPCTPVLVGTPSSRSQW